MKTEKIYGKNFVVDWHDTKKEVDEIKELIASWQLKKSDLYKIKDYINKDKRIANELYLSNPADKALIWLFVKELKQTKPNIFEDLKKHKLVNENGDLPRLWSGSKWVKLLQIMLNHLTWANLKVDWLYGPNTFWALVQYQKWSDIYKSTSLADVQNFANSKNLGVTFRWNMSEVWAPDGIADWRTIFSMFKSLVANEKIENKNTEQDNANQKERVVVSHKSDNIKKNISETSKQEVESKEKSIWEPVWYLKDGHYYILWKNW